jgi:hypothetical protein
MASVVRTLKKVLIVDDNPAIRSEIHQEFNRHGFLCSNAENRRQAIEQVLEILPDLIILDLSMLVMNGLDAAPRTEKKPSRLSYHSLHPFCGYPGSVVGCRSSRYNSCCGQRSLSRLVDRPSKRVAFRA